MKPTVYIETSVISYYTSDPSRDLIIAAHQQITYEWWKDILPLVEPYISQAVIEEISRGDLIYSKKRLKSVKDFSILELLPNVNRIAQKYIKALQLPSSAEADAYHLAVAVYHGIDYIISWNCKHIASGRVRRILENLNSEMAIITPVICTPEELLEV